MQVTIIPKFPDDCEQWEAWDPELLNYQGKTGTLCCQHSDGIDVKFSDGETWCFRYEWVQKPYTPGVWYPWDPEEAKKHSQLLIYGSVISVDGFREVMQAYQCFGGAWVDAIQEPIVNTIQFLIIPKVSD